MATRRKTLLGLGSLLVGGGAIISTGAFSSVSAQRSVALETADDSEAFLAFEIIDGDHVSETDGTIGFELLTEAKTRFEELVDVRNQGTQTVRSLRFEFEVTGATQSDPAVEEALRITSGSTTIPASDDTNLLVESDQGGAGNDELAPGEAVPFGIVVDLTDTAIDSIDGNPDIALTITADTDGSGGGASGPTGTIDSVSLAQQGNSDWLDVTISVTTDDAGAQLHIESLWPDANPNDVRDETTVSAADGTYSVLGANQVDRVRVTLRSSAGATLDTVTRNWSL